MSRKTGRVLLGTTLVFLAGLLVFNLVVDPPAANSRVSTQAVVGAIVGQVEIRTGGQARWTSAEVGALLSTGDEVRTGPFSEATLHLRGSSSVIVSLNSTFVVGQERVWRSSFELGEGRITAAIPPDAKRSYQFRSRGSRAVAASKQGEFSLTTDGKGTVVVDTTAGSVELRARGEKVVVPKGKRSVVLPDKPPSKVLPVPSSLALQVRWPPTKTDRTRARISGKTSVAATVMVNGILVRADDEGLFSLDVPLRQGTNRVVVTATDTSGNTTIERSPEIQVDSRPPDVDVNAEDLWK